MGGAVGGWRSGVGWCGNRWVRRQQEIDEKEFISRNLNDTRYITSHLVNVIKQHLICNQVVSVKGGFTSNLRHKLKIEIPMDEAYGDYDEELVEELTKADFADFDDIYEGMEFVVELEDGTEMIAVITEIDGDKVYTDSNHPFSGRNLLFEVEVADVREATDEELDHGHVHFHGFEDDEE